MIRGFGTGTEKYEMTPTLKKKNFLRIVKAVASSKCPAGVIGNLMGGWIGKIY